MVDIGAPAAAARGTSSGRGDGVSCCLGGRVGGVMVHSDAGDAGDDVEDNVSHVDAGVDATVVGSVSNDKLLRQK